MSVAPHRLTAPALLLALLAAAAASGADYFPADAVALQQALDDAEVSPEDDTIHLAATTYSTAAIGLPFRFVGFNSGALTLDGEGPASTLLDGNGVRQVLFMETNDSVVVSDLALVNGALATTGGVDLEGAAADIDVFDTGCPPLVLSVTNVLVANTHAVATDASIIGGVMYLNLPCGVLTLTDLTFSGNSATQLGTFSMLGGILRTGNVSDSPLTTVVTDLTYTGNSVASSGGGALYGGLADFNSNALTIDGMDIGPHTVTSHDIGNSDSYGAVVSIFAGDGDVLLSDVSVVGTTVGLSGDQIGNQVRGGVVSVIFEDSTSVVLDRWRLENNTFVDTGAATITGAILNVNGSGLSTVGTVTLSASRILGNRGTSMGQSLGLISVVPLGGRVSHIVNNAFGNNRLTVTGTGDVLGTLLAGGEPLTLVHNTLWNNVLTSGGPNNSGGGLFFGNGGEAVNLYNNVIWGNSASLGADVRLFAADYDVILSHNDIGDLSLGGGATVIVDQGNLDVDPLLVPGDFHLAFGSPVIDVGDPAAPLMPAFDLDGDPRVIPPAPDMGADEAVAGGVVPPPPSIVAIPTLSWPSLLTLGALLALLGARLLRT